VWEEKLEEKKSDLRVRMAPILYGADSKNQMLGTSFQA
jgi:hypothetical protein